MSSGKYAAGTEVTSGRSREEIERTLTRYGASEFAYAWGKDRAMVGFVASGRQVRFELPMPDREDEEFTLTPSKKFLRSESEAEKAYEAAVRQKWRALALVVKAKLEAVEAGIVTFDQEFLSHLVLPEGDTVGDRIMVPLTRALDTGTTPQLLPGLHT